MNFGVHIALANDTTAALFKVARSPGCIKVMQSDKSVLDVHAGSHLKGRTHKNTDLTGTDFAEQFLFASFGVCLVDESNLLSRNTSRHKFLTDVIIHCEARFFLDTVFLCKMLQGSEFRAVQITGRSFGNLLCRRAFRCREVAKDELCQFVVVSFLPNAVNVIHAHIDFACRLVWKIRIDDTLVKSEFTTVSGNAEHIVHGRVNLTRMNRSGSFG